MTNRYEIKELVEQDETGVIYRVRDREGGGMAALRRFFPLNSPGSGFAEDEAEAYEGTVRALKKLRHESLCAVLGGGVDAVDGVPYLLTELPEGENLEEMLERGSLEPEQAVAVAGQGLELLGVLGEIFGGEREWLEMEAAAVVVNAETGLCRFTICPLQVLGVAKRDGGVRGLGYLLERLMGWTGQLVPPGAAAGLGGWVAKSKSGEWSVHEAYAELVRIRRVWTGEEVPTPAAVQAIVVANANAAVQPIVAAPTRVYQAPSSAGTGRWAAVICFSLILSGGGIWLLIKQPWMDTVATVSNEAAGSNVGSAEKPGGKPALTAQERIDRNVRKAAEALAVNEESRSPQNKPGLPERIQPKEDPPKSDPIPVPVSDPEPVKPEPDPEPEPDVEPVMPDVFAPEDGKVMREWIGSEVVLEAELLRVRDSKSGKTRYLEFSNEKGDVLIRCWPGKSGLDLEGLQGLIGKKLRFTGKAKIEPLTDRVVLHIDERSQIEEVN